MLPKKAELGIFTRFPLIVRTSVKSRETFFTSPIMGDPQIQEINDTESPGLRVLLDVTKTPERRF